MAVFPVTGILGPRQSGKTTLARQLSTDHFFDLENPRDAAMLAEPQLALEPLTGLIVIDEIQRASDLFPLIRYLVDGHPDQRYVILGSASRALIRQSSESLAGRVAYHELAGFRLGDVGSAQWRDLWLRGGLPRAYTAATDEDSHLWREQYVATGKNWGVELKYADAPRLTRSMAVAVADLELEHLWVVYPGDRSYALAEKVSTLPLAGIGDRWSYS